VVHVIGDHGLRHLSEVSPKHARDVVGGICFLFPIEIFAILFGISARTIDDGCATHARWSLEGCLEFAHAPVGSANAERARHLRR